MTRYKLNGYAWRPWFDTVKRGDVLIDKFGNERIVRAVHKYKSNICLTFAIRHCSWTGRCYTVLNKADLIYRGFRYSGVTLPLKDPIDKAIDHDITYEHRFRQKTPCCKVVAIGVK